MTKIIPKIKIMYMIVWLVIALTFQQNQIVRSHFINSMIYVTIYLRPILSCYGVLFQQIISYSKPSVIEIRKVSQNQIDSIGRNSL